MIAGTMFRTPEETALQLELLLLGTITEGTPPEGPLSAAPLDDERWLREMRRVLERVHGLAETGEEAVGLVGAVSPAARAHVSAVLAAGVAARRPVTLLDADLRTGLLSFDARTYAQEGLVDVIRYGVRSPRVVAPTRVPGLSLLPVGSGTVDLAGTWGADSIDLLLRELARTGDLLVVNGPGIEDLDEAGPFLDRIASWILVHEIGASDPEATLRVRDRIGADRLLGVLVLHPRSARPMAPGREHALADEDEYDPEERAERIEDEPTAVFPAAARASLDAPAAASIDDAGQAPPRRRSFLPLVLGLGALGIAAAIVLPRVLSPERGARPSIANGPVLTPEEAERQAEELLGRMSAIDRAPGTTVEDPSPTPPGQEPALPTGQEITTQPPTVAPPPAPAKEPAAKATPPPKPPSASPGGTFAVHLSSLHMESKANEDAAKFRAAGFDVFVRRVDLGAKGIWYRVFAGPFDDRAAADAAADQIKKRGVSEYALVQRISKSAGQAP